MKWAAITGWGMAVPDRIVTNAQLARSIPGIDEDWIVRRSGIRERRYAGVDASTSTLAAAAGARALARSGSDARDVDLVIVATTTPDMPIPGTAPTVQHQLGAVRAGAFDINAACAGFLTGLAVADSMIRSGSIQRALVIGAEVLSRFLDRSDPKSCVLFGDGAGAVVVESSDTPAGMLSWSMGASGDATTLIRIPAGGSLRPASEQTVAAGEHVIRMNGPEVYRAAVRIMSEAATGAIAAAAMTPPDVNLLIVHQANSRIVDEVGARVGIPPERVFCNVERYGNTSAASVPIAICEAAELGALRDGSRFVLCAVGAGFTWTAGAGIWTAASAQTRASSERIVEVVG